MLKIIHDSASRGTADYGWLKANCAFSFANFFDENRMGFGKLRIPNDDRIAPSMGFSAHSHNNMEIVPIILEVALRHKDDIGHELVIHPRGVQVMGAGTGVAHSEFNVSDVETSLLQLWALPEGEGVEPRYDQKGSDDKDKKDHFLTMVAPKGKSDVALLVHQQAYLSLGDLGEGVERVHPLHDNSHGAYILVVEGEMTIDGKRPPKRDAMGIWSTDRSAVSSHLDSKLLLIEVPMN